MIEEVFFKQFSNFTARKVLNIPKEKHKLIIKILVLQKAPIQITDDSSKLNLVFVSKNRWKRLRSIINPTFSPAKLKEVGYA